MQRWAYIPPSETFEGSGLDLATWQYPLDVDQFNSEHNIYVPDQTDEWLQENYFFKINPAPLPPIDVENSDPLIISNYVRYAEGLGHFAGWRHRDIPREGDISMGEDEILASNRHQRNRLLLLCDYTQGNDSPLTEAKKTEWATYRQQLRDLPASLSTFNSAILTDSDLPTKPS